jgi:hypothetical protein
LITFHINPIYKKCRSDVIKSYVMIITSIASFPLWFRFQKRNLMKKSNVKNRKIFS